jgi:phage shock protein PspC (stress-responsive transcriptional regulator)
MSKKIRLYRNTRRRRLGGVCAGIADLLNINVSWVRIFFLLSIFLSFGITFWSYIFMWVIVPAKPTIAIPNVSKSRVNDLKKLDRLVRKIHRQLDHSIADRVEETFDAVKMLVGQLESTSAENNQMLKTWNDAKTNLTVLMKQLLVSASTDTADQNSIIKHLDALRQQVQEIGQDALQSELNQSNISSSKDTPDWQAWKVKMAPILEQLKERAGPQVLSLTGRIEQKLAFLLNQEEQGGLLDVSRFEVKQIANKYLPKAINEYLKLPADLAKTHRLSNNFTAEEMLSEQLIRLDHALEELVVSLFEQDAQGLLIHGRFLKYKFANDSFKIDVPEGVSGQKV